MHIGIGFSYFLQKTAGISHFFAKKQRKSFWDAVRPLLKGDIKINLLVRYRARE